MRVFSGIQPTNQLHIGNYLGAIKQWVKLQDGNECLFCIVDWHAITVPYQPQEMQKLINEVAAIYLAAGIDPEKSIIFIQSQVKEHAELAWLLNTITPLGDLQRMHQFKEKSKKQAKNLCAGLLNYPVLMAADILLYQTDLVPVGEDQKQHVELAREIARRFNAKFGETFNLPKAFIPKSGSRIMSLTAPDKKMSKSDKPESRISLFDSPEQIKNKIASATTDSEKEIKYDEKNKPGISNLLTIFSLFSEKPTSPVRNPGFLNGVKEIENDFKNKGYAQFKQALSELLIKKLEPFRQKQEELNESPAIIKEVLTNGAFRAKNIAEQTMVLVRKNMGL